MPRASIPAGLHANVFNVSIANLKMREFSPTPKRKYQMSARAEAKLATRERILEAAGSLLWQIVNERSSLEDVAKGAGTTVQTILRHFGSKEALLEAVAQRASETVRRERAEAPIGDIPGAVSNLIEHYERYGQMVVRMLAEEHRIPILGKAADHGRELHREWVIRTFEPQLADLDRAERERRIAQLVLGCDVYAWKLLRVDMKLSIPQTQATLVELIQRLVGER